MCLWTWQTDKWAAHRTNLFAAASWMGKSLIIFVTSYVNATRKLLPCNLCWTRDMNSSRRCSSRHRSRDWLSTVNEDASRNHFDDWRWNCSTWCTCTSNPTSACYWADEQMTTDVCGVVYCTSRSKFLQSSSGILFALFELHMSKQCSFGHIEAIFCCIKQTPVKI